MPDTPPAPPSLLAWLPVSGETSERVRAHDWAGTSLGPPDAWPPALRTALGMVLGSRYEMWMGWGPDLAFFCNDAYARATLGAKRAHALGRPAREVWAEVWHLVDDRAQAVLQTGAATWDEGLLLLLERDGYPEETYHTFSYSPIPDGEGGVGGLLCVVVEETGRVVGQRRLRLLQEVSFRTADAATPEDAVRAAAEALATNRHDFPWAALYLEDETGGLRRAALVGICPEHPAAGPAAVEPEAAGGPSDPPQAWPLHAVMAGGEPALVDLPPGPEPLPSGPWERPPERAVLLPLVRRGGGAHGVLVAALTPHRPYDDDFRAFAGLVSEAVAAAVAGARVRDEERRRAHALAELDRAKTAFFQNVSHELRTPLTLLLGPIEDALAEAPAGPERERLDLAHRNALRLHRHVDALLDFARVEAGRAEGVFEPADLPALTADLASQFRAAIERAGLRFEVEAPPLGEPVWVEGGMWETVVLNLLSNALKHTFEGEIRVALRREGQGTGARAVLAVSDTGTGIPAAELPRLFERFHRVEGATFRTHEGTGIGLALVRELARLHGGEVAVESAPGEGTTFKVSLPFGTGHLPPERVRAEASAAGPASRTPSGFVEEALRWLPPGGNGPSPAPLEGPSSDVQGSAEGSAPSRPRVLVADDNADLRAYITHALSPHYEVEAVPDGEAALDAALARPPDLVLADVMMPRRDGLALLAALRGEPATRAVPVMLLSARAGLEARAEGMEAGADDYLTKPFATRELVARVGAHLALAQMRRQTADREVALRKTAERAARRTARLQAITAGLVGALTPADVASVILDEGLDAIGAYAGSVLLLDRQADELRRVHSRGYPLHMTTNWDRIPLSATVPLTDAVRGARSVWVHSPDDLATRYPALALPDDRTESRAYAVLPLLSGGEAFGALALAFREPCTFGPDERAFAEALAAQTALALDRARLFEAERASRERAQFRAALADALRPLADPGAIQAEAARLLGEHLGVAGVAYFEVRGPDFVIERDYVSGLHPLRGRYPASSFGPKLLAAYRAGRVVVAPDVTTDPELSPSERAAFAALGARAFIGVPLVKDGQFVAGLALHHVRPHAWTPEEVALTEEVTERTWATLEQARAEAALREREARYHALFTSIDDGFALCEMVVDEAGKPVDYRFLEVNPAFGPLTGIEAAAPGRTARELVPGLEDHWVQTYARVGLGGEALRFEQGSEVMGRWFNVYAAPVEPAGSGRFALVFSDVTARKAVEATIRDRERLFRDMADTAPAMLWTTDPDGQCTFLSASWYAFTGQSEPEGFGMGWTDAVHSEDRARAGQAFLDASTQRAAFSADFRLRRADGTYRWVIDAGRPWFDADGAFRGFVGAVLDVHDRREAEDALRLANETLEGRVAERTRDVRALSSALTLAEQRERERLSRVLHDDLQQVLFGLLLRAQTLQDVAPPEIVPRAEAIGKLAHEALQTTRSLAAELAPPVLRGEGLAPSLRWLAAHAGQTYGIRVLADGVADTPEPSEGARVLLFQTARELLLNAAKHAGVDQVRLALRHEGDGLVLEVEDEGRGFDPAQSPPEHLPASGLGLASLRDRLAHFGGRLEVDAAPGRGTRARAVLPLADPLAP